jgi:hypothetical protein
MQATNFTIVDSHVGIRSNLLCPTLSDISNSKDGMNGMVENNTDHSMMWRDALTSDLETRPPAFVSQDLSEILLNYGLQVQSTTKRLKPNGVKIERACWSAFH